MTHAALHIMYILLEIAGCVFIALCLYVFVLGDDRRSDVPLPGEPSVPWEDDE